ncbi:MAG: peptidase M14 [Myxococcaceae bacterium]|nr:peptidase M14 [Myxococcaceae bacterium]
MVLALLLAAAAPLTTESERSGFVTTGRYAEVEQLCAEFPRRYPGLVRCEKFGQTPQGRPMLALVASADGTFEPKANQAKKRPVLLAEGGIHAGEIDGKDAGFWVLRELLDGAKAKDAILAKVTFVFVPVFNIDGHERFGPNNRPNQVGPKEMGFRVNARNLNLNRDWLKAEAPETQAMVGLLTRYDPILFADLHVTDGAKFQPDVAVNLEPQQGFAQPLKPVGQQIVAKLFEGLKAQGHQPLPFYPSFDKEDEPLSGFTYGIPPPRFGNGFWALHHRFGVLVETHSWKDYAARVKVTHDVLLGLLDLARRDGATWLAAAAEADAKPEGGPLELRYGSTGETETIDFPGYAFTRERSEVSGKFWVRYDDAKPQVWKVPYAKTVKPTVTAAPPQAGWVVPAEYAAVVRPKLEVHGVTFRELTKAVENAPVEVFRVTQAKFKGAPYEGRQTVALEGAYEKSTRTLAKGSLFVPAAQRLPTLAAHLLEPLGPDSLAQWGFFNAHLEEKEYLEDYLAEDYARTLLKDPAVKQAFEEKIAKDADFAKSPERRLHFFYERHPAYDPRFNVLPVVRVDVAP